MQHFLHTDLAPTEKLPFYPCMIIVQARMGSERLAGKVLKEVLGKPLLFYLIERLRRVKYCDGIVIATSQNPLDDAIAAFCDQHGIYCVRASEHDVLSRYYSVCSLFDPEVLVRITADCPLIDPELIDKGLCCFAHNFSKLDYLSNTLKRTFARGMDFEIMRKSALEKAYFEATSSYDKEHVTAYIARQPELFRLGSYTQAKDESHLRLTVDTPEDFQLIQTLLEALYPKNPEYSLAEIVQILHKHPEWVAMNAHIEQKS